MEQEFLNQLHEANPIEQVVGDYVQLKRAGRNYVCTCPFHSEKSPSCTVFPETQSFYCFGGGVGGDIITFVKKIENLTFGEAVEKLASRCGMKVPTDEKTRELTRLKERILDINRETANFYYKNLLKGEDKRGLLYFSKRKLKPETIKKYGLGYAPDAYTVLYEHLKHLGFSDYEMLEAQVCRRGERGMYDIFRNRVMFPIISEKGSVIGFGGRVLDDSKPKYLNTPQTKVFDKGRNCFSYNFAKDSSSRTMILAEGYMDVIAMNQAGFDNVVATLGTALTSEQAKLIAKHSDRVVISYDGDEAGQKAARRAINILSEVGLKTAVLKIEGAKDPDEFIKKYGAERFRRIVNNAGDALEFQIDRCREGLNLDDESDKGKFIKKASEILADISEDIMRELYISKFCRDYDFDKNVLLSHVENVRKRNRAEKKAERWKKVSGQTYRSNKTFVMESKREKAEKLIMLMLLKNSRYYDEICQNLSPDNFSDETLKKVFEIIKNSKPHEVTFQSLSEFLDDEQMSKISAVLSSGNSIEADYEEFQMCLDVIKKPFENSTESITDQDILDIVKAKRI